jgi:MtN3 and saliva related transmembrane protein
LIGVGMNMQWVGWGAAVILLLTIGRQIWTQWKTGTSAGVSKWLFVGQVAASIGFIAYSVAEGDPVFIVTNGLMLLTAVLGEVIFWRNRRREIQGIG